MNVLRTRRVRLVPALLAAVFGSVVVTPDARALGSGGITVEFSVSGRLDTFPTASGRTYFWGQASGTGVLTSLNGGTTAEFTHLTMPVSGHVDYGEPSFPLCPLLGSAANGVLGQIVVGAPTVPGTTGITYTAGRTNTGIVTGVVYVFDVTYQRVGPSATLVFGVIPGSARATVYFTTPGQGPGEFTVQALAAGEAVFQADYVQATTNCMHPSPSNPPIEYLLTGVVTGSAT